MEARLIQDLPALDETAQAEIYEAKDSAFRTDDLYSELDKVRAILHCRERQLLAALADASKAAEELTRVRAMARRIERDRDDWAREGGKLQLELARERERHQEAVEMIRYLRPGIVALSYFCKNAELPMGQEKAREMLMTIDESALLAGEPQPAPASQPFWNQAHKFEAKVFQGREQLACEVCGRLEGASVHA